MRGVRRRAAASTAWATSARGCSRPSWTGCPPSSGTGENGCRSCLRGGGREAGFAGGAAPVRVGACAPAAGLSGVLPRGVRCRDEWRSAGPAGVFCLLARAALDTLVSVPPLWAERLEETMKGHSADCRWGFWLADHGLAMGGLALLAVGAATSWWAMSLGWAALAIAFFAWVAEADGLLALPRLGRVAIRTGSLDTPLAFKVRRGE